MFRRFLASATVLAVLLGTGCATKPAAPATSPVTPAAIVIAETHPKSAALPPPAMPATAIPVGKATILGSEETSALLDNFTAYLVAIDGAEIAAGRKGWATPVDLPAGPHRLTVGFVRGVFNATAELEITARPDAAYEIRHASDTQIYGKNSYCEFWIVNKNTGEKITGIVRVKIERLKQT